MGGVTVRYEANSTEGLDNFPEACQIFKEVGWLKFLEQLRGSDESISLEFSLNLSRNQTEVRGLKLEITEEVVA